MLDLFETLTPFSYPATRVVVLSDSDYKRYQQEQAEREILVLQSKLNRYNTAVEEITVEIEKIKKNAGLLAPSPQETPTPSK